MRTALRQKHSATAILFLVLMMASASSYGAMGPSGTIPVLMGMDLR